MKYTLRVVTGRNHDVKINCC